MRHKYLMYLIEARVFFLLYYAVSKQKYPVVRAYLPSRARRFMYSSKVSLLGTYVCFALGSDGSNLVSLGSRV